MGPVVGESDDMTARSRVRYDDKWQRVLRVVHGSDGPAGRVRSRFCRILAGRVSTSEFLVFLLIISGFLNQCEFSNTAFELVGFLRYFIYIIIKQLINNYLIKLNIYIRF